MKVILLENIKKLGRKYEVVEVSDGYATNFLLRQNKAELATDGNLKSLENKKKQEEKKEEEKKAEIEKLIKKIEDKEFVIKTKVGEKEQLYEAITADKIANHLQEEGYNVLEKQIQLEEPIKKLTEEEIKINFKHNLNTKIKIKIKEE